MKISSVFGAMNIRAETLGGRPHRKRIDCVDLEYEDDQAEPTAYLYFLDDERRLRLNPTNASVLQEAFGDETDDWQGKSVVLTSVGRGEMAWVRVSPLVETRRRRRRARK